MRRQQVKIIRQINLAKSAGLCFGVKRAIKIACELAHGGREIYMLGDLVHNKTVTEALERAGIRKISRLGPGKGKTLLIRAHGASLALLERARKHGYNIVDATCPMVREIHNIVQRMDSQGYRIIVIGDSKHDEVLGIVGQIKTKAVVLNSPRKIPWTTLANVKKAAIVVQSTQNIDKVIPIVRALRKKIQDVPFFNTICRPTRMKQEEMKTMPLRNDVMIIIGSRTSANTRRLYEISSELNPDSYWIQSSRELKRKWFTHKQTVGVTAGASTPDGTTKSVMKRICRM